MWHMNIPGNVKIHCNAVFGISGIVELLLVPNCIDRASLYFLQIAMISPGMNCCEHTLNTLRYADR